VQPLPCDVKDFFFASINPTLGGRTFGTPDPQFAELWWDYPDTGSSECSRYIAMNYAMQGNPWIIGTRARTAGDKAGALYYPILAGLAPDGTHGALYQHETGFQDNGADRAANGLVWAETGAITLGEGDTRFNVRQVVVDGNTDPANPAFGFRFFAKEQPFDTNEWDTGLYTSIHNGLLDIRFSGRSVRMRVVATRDVQFEIGRTRLDGVPAGTR
jgi:hypothetical protein